MGYYWKFIGNFEKLSEPLVQLLQSTPFEWTTSQQQFFEALKDTLKRAPALFYTDYNKELLIYKDVSGVAIGAILS